MNNTQVAHVWANQHINGRTGARGSNFYFDGPTIYSYGGHFPIARFVEHKGKRCLLFTRRSYSISTSKHINYVWRALANTDIPIFYVNDLLAFPGGNLNEFSVTDDLPRLQKEIRDSVGALLVESGCSKFRPRRRMAARAAAVNGIEMFNAVSKFFGSRKRMSSDDKALTRIVVASERMRIADEKAVAAQEAARKKREEARLAVAAGWLEAWKKGDDSREGRCYFGDFPVVLRIKPNQDPSTPDVLETSHGAQVPEAHARRAARIVKRTLQNMGAPDIYVTTGTRVTVTVRVGDFQVTAIEFREDGPVIVAGCHRIPVSEMERLGNERGWFAEPPSMAEDAQEVPES